MSLEATAGELGQPAAQVGGEDHLDSRGRVWKDEYANSDE